MNEIKKIEARLPDYYLSPDLYGILFAFFCVQNDSQKPEPDGCFGVTLDSSYNLYYVMKANVVLLSLSMLPFLSGPITMCNAHSCSLYIFHWT